MRKDYDYDDEDDDAEEYGGWPLGAVGAVVVAALAIGAAFVFGVLPPGGDGDDEQVSTASESDESVDPLAQPVDSEAVTTEPAGDADATGTSDAADESQSDPESELDAQDADPQDIDAAEGADASDTNAQDAAAPTTVDAATNAPPAEPVASQPSYPVLPDGTPVPVLVIFDGDLITLSGVAPSEQAADRLRTLAIAFSKVPDAEVASFISIDPTIPANLGVRVIEMNSIRFPEGAPTVSPEHALELNRVALMMNALPQVTTLVIGHADQRGDSEVNFKLSTERSRAAADYIASQGVDPTRLSSRGAGESDLLTLNDDAAALALNRRTEFVVSGLLVDPTTPAEAPQS